MFDLAPRIEFSGVFEPLREPAFFARVTVDPEIGTVVWPNGADLDPLVLYDAVTGKSLDLRPVSAGSLPSV
jgi:hypothetical protein